MATANKLSLNRGPYEGSTSVFVLFFWFFTFYCPLFIVMNKFVLTLIATLTAVSHQSASE